MNVMHSLNFNCFFFDIIQLNEFDDVKEHYRMKRDGFFFLLNLRTDAIDLRKNMNSFI